MGKSYSMGFTILEVMVSLILLAIGIVAFAAMQSFFANDVKNRFIYGCLTTVSSNGIAICMSGQQIPSTVQCGGIQVNLNVNCPQPTSGCSTITSTASYNSLSYSQIDSICSSYNNNNQSQPNNSQPLPPGPQPSPPPGPPRPPHQPGPHPPGPPLFAG